MGSLSYLLLLVAICGVCDSEPPSTGTCTCRYQVNGTVTTFDGKQYQDAEFPDGTIILSNMLHRSPQFECRFFSHAVKVDGGYEFTVGHIFSPAGLIFSFDRNGNPYVGINTPFVQYTPGPGGCVVGTMIPTCPGISMAMCGTEIVLTVPAPIGALFSGNCGNCNGNPDDDVQTPDSRELFLVPASA